MIVTAMHQRPALTFVLAWFTYDVLSLFSVFTTAYAFIRKHTLLLL